MRPTVLTIYFCPKSLSIRDVVSASIPRPLFSHGLTTSLPLTLGFPCATCRQGRAASDPLPGKLATSLEDLWLPHAYMLLLISYS